MQIKYLEVGKMVGAKYMTFITNRHNVRILVDDVAGFVYPPYMEGFMVIQTQLLCQYDRYSKT